MNWRPLLVGSIEYNYAVTAKLFDKLTDSELDWKPATGTNWMTVGQLLMHCTNACGFCIRGFATGDWGMPPEAATSEGEHEMLPPAESMPAVKSIAEAKALLEADRKVSLEIIANASDEELETRICPAPWDPMQLSLGHRSLQMIEHLVQHKGQLFYYLKLMGKQVDTNDLWGM